MERLTNCEFIIDILEIENISSTSQCFEIIFSTTDRKKYKFVFERVWDMRYSLETTNVDRFYEFYKNLPEGHVKSCIYIVENSEYIKYFDSQVYGIYPTDELTHYIIGDQTDTLLDILACYHKPVLVPLP